jgi:hypothetical protein
MTASEIEKAVQRLTRRIVDSLMDEEPPITQGELVQVAIRATCVTLATLTCNRKEDMHYLSLAIQVEVLEFLACLKACEDTVLAVIHSTKQE